MKQMCFLTGKDLAIGVTYKNNNLSISLDAPCPHNYNPADYYIQLLAMVPGQEESSKNAINMICESFVKSEIGIKMSVEASTLVSYT